MTAPARRPARTRPGRLLPAVTLLVLLGGLAPAARAQDATQRERAKALLREGNALFESGNYLEALERFKRVHELVPSPRVHYNFGETYFQLGRPVDALRHYELYVQGAPDDQPVRLGRANQQIARLQGEIASVLLRVSLIGAEVTADGQPAGTTPLIHPIRLRAGPHVLVVTKPGHEPVVLRLTLRAGEVASHLVTLLTEDEAAGRRRGFREVEAERRAAQERLRVAEQAERERRARQRRLLRTTAWATLATAVALGVTSGTCGLLAHREATTIAAAVPGTARWTDLQPHADRFAAFRLAAYVTAGVGAALAVGGAVVLALSYRGDEPAPGRPPRLSARPALGPGGAGLTLGGSF
ncbi:MAG TPA: tetratricopeptide repeat protein [Polyangia bacterium]|jgi:tetratricopeptide (TPR) repeat protein